ncbi:hypothetical protein LTR17_019311 [Elasticomyces elasticus]|nr:hypothetical protein LTR17_019311 [Elasticomyces elasticus]
MELVVRNSSHEPDTTWFAEALRVAASRLYTPIKDWQTRILRLHPGVSEDPLTADLLVAGLAHGDGLVIGMDQDLVSYEAVSYSWGEFKPCVPITINGQDYLLTESLAGALHRFRLASAERYLWADALCINQFDKYEKSAQVRNMFTIYHKAQRVLAWLGHEGIGTADAITKATQSWDTKPDSHEINALADLCFRSWARRVWVQQEVFAAQDLVLFCGPSELNLETYQMIAGYLLFQQRTPEPLTNEPIGIATNAIRGLHTAGLHSISAIEAARIHPREEGWGTSWEPTYGLAHVLARCKSFEASDPRDYIFALLGLTNCVSGNPSASPVDQDTYKRPLPFSVDYTMSVSEVFQQATKYILNSDRSLLLLSESGSSNLPPSDPLLPSWTIDWRTWRRHRSFSQRLGRSQDDVPDPPRLLQWQPAVNDGLLRLSGIILGSVKSIEVNYEKFHGGVFYCHVVWELHDAVPRTYKSHHQDWGPPGRSEVRIHEQIAVGDIVVRVDGCLYSETLCLRPAPDERFRFVCMITDGDDLGVMMKDGISKELCSCDGGFDEWLVEQMVGDMASPPIERGFVVC